MKEKIKKCILIVVYVPFSALLLLGNWNLGMLESGHRGKLAYGNWAYGIRACGLLAYGILAYLYKGHIHLEYQGRKQGGPRGHPPPFFSRNVFQETTS